MRILTLCSDNMGGIIKQQAQWSGYITGDLEMKTQLLCDLQNFLNSFQAMKTNAPMPPQKILSKKERMDKLLDEFKQLKELPDDLPIES